MYAHIFRHTYLHMSSAHLSFATPNNTIVMELCNSVNDLCIHTCICTQNYVFISKKNYNQKYCFNREGKCGQFLKIVKSGRSSRIKGKPKI